MPAKSEIMFGTHESVLERPSTVAEGNPVFYDQWEEYVKTLPQNLNFSWLRGSKSCYDIWVRQTPQSRVHFVENLYAPNGVQLPERVFEKAFNKAVHLSQDNFQVIHMRQDHELLVPETWANAPFRDIAQHSMHKIPQSQLETDFVQVEGRWWNKRDYEEAELAKTFGY